MCKSSATPSAGETPATPPEMYLEIPRKPAWNAPRPYPMTKIEDGYPWTL